MAAFESVARAWRLRSAFEVRLLRVSIYATGAVAVLGVALGLLTGSFAIIFDGLYSGIDAAITVLMIAVAKLVASEGSKRFQFGFWHLEPLVLGFKASVLILLIGYALVNAVQQMLSGGNEPTLGPALAYAAVVTALCFAIWAYMRRQNERLESELVRLEVHGWLMSALVTGALLIAFGAAWVMQGTAFRHLIPYVDPAVLAFLSLALLPIPLAEVRRSFREIFEEAPADLDAEVRDVMQPFIARHGFSGFESYVSKVGRARFIEVSILVPASYPPATVAHFDALRAEIGDGIGDPGPDRWLTIIFTSDPSQL
ncbi:MAG: cation diffusion facilitator family transporter [Sandaracinobacteroides sp.]